jgi:hypothetical protein
VAQAYAAAQPVAVPVAMAAVPAAPAAFQSIFSDTGRQGVAPVVRTLWTKPGDNTAQGGKPFNLFSD